MKKIYFSAITFLLLCSGFNPVNAQAPQWVWSRSYGNTGAEYGTKIAADSRNGVYSYGSFTSNVLNIGTNSFSNSGGADLFLIKHDTLGNIKWAKAFGSTGTDTTGSITTDRLGNIIITGAFSNTISIGSYTFISSGQKNVFAAKLDNAGNILWAIHFPSSGNAFSTAIKTDVSDNIYIAGNYYDNSIVFGNITLPSSNVTNIFYAKLRQDGSVIWAKNSSSNISYVRLFNIQFLNDSRVLLLGTADGQGTIQFDPAGSGIPGIPVSSSVHFFAKLDTAGSYITQKATQGQGSLAAYYNSTLGNKNDIITSGRRLFLLNPAPSAIFTLTDSNLVNKNIQNAGSNPSAGSSSSWANDVIYTQKDKRIFFIGNSFGHTTFGNSYEINAPGKYTVYLLEKDSLFNSKNLLFSSPGNNMPGEYVAGAVDTLTNSIYFTGALRTSSPPSVFGRDTLYGNGGNDILVSKISINGYMPVFSLNDTVICSGSSVALGMNDDPSFGQGPYTYSWTPAAGLTDPSSIRTFATPATTTTYTLQITDALSNSVTQTVTVAVKPTPATPTISAGGPLSFCTGGSVTLTSSPGQNYLWSNGATTQSITVNTSGNYSVKDSVLGCVSSPATINVQVNPIPATPTISANGPLNFCEGNNVVLTASTGHNYLWSNGATTQSITVNASGNFAVKDSAAGCVSPSSTVINVQVNPIPATPTISANGPLSFCEGNNVVLTASTGHNYIWSNGATTQSITVNASGNYAVKDSAAGCVSPSSTVINVQVNPIPAIPTISAGGPLTFCEGGSVTLTSSAGHNYLWSNGATTQSITVNASGNYAVKDSAAGCVSASSAIINVQVNPIPAIPTISASGPLSFCEGGSVTLTSSAGHNYLWSNGASTQSITVNTSGNYAVKDSAAGCVSPSSTVINVQVNPTPAIPTISAGGPLTFCEGGSVTLTSSAGHNYLWSNGASTQSITVNTSGNFFVRDSLAGCVSSTSVSKLVTVNDNPPVPVITQTGNLLSSSAATGNQWYLNGAIINGATASTYIYTIAGDYSVKVTNASGCSAVSEDVTVSRLNTISILSDGKEFMHQVIPNPVGYHGKLHYNLQSASKVSIIIVNENGKKVATLLNSQLQQAGYYTIPLSGNTNKLVNGMYFIVYQVNSDRVMDKLILTR